jgi:hypothetical protein
VRAAAAARQVTKPLAALSPNRDARGSQLPERAWASAPLVFSLLACFVACASNPAPKAGSKTVQPPVSLFTLSVDPVNHHLHKPYFVAEVGATGSVKVVWKTPGVIAPVAPSPQEAD